MSKSSSTLSLESPAFENGGVIPAVYTCDGKRSSPPLSISGAPKRAKSLALIMEDPDAPGGTWVHWVAFDMDPDTHVIPENTEPIATAGKGTSGDLKYYPPCPPNGVHVYILHLYALDSKLGLNEGVTADEVRHAMEGHIVAETALVGRYGEK